MTDIFKPEILDQLPLVTDVFDNYPVYHPTGSAYIVPEQVPADYDWLVNCGSSNFDDVGSMLVLNGWALAENQLDTYPEDNSCSFQKWFDGVKCDLIVCYEHEYYVKMVRATILARELKVATKLHRKLIFQVIADERYIASPYGREAT